MVAEPARDGDDQPTTSMATKKFRRNKNQKLGMIYVFVMFALSVSAAVSSERHDHHHHTHYNYIDQVPAATQIGLISFACLSMIIMTIYLECHRKSTFENLLLPSSGPILVKYSKRGETLNLTLRFGVLMFCSMTVAYAVFQLKEADPIDWSASILLIVFAVCQTLFILRYHRLVILWHTKTFGLLFLNVMVTDLCLWAQITVDKFKHLTDIGRKAKQQSDALMPAVSEFVLMSAAITFEILNRTGQPSCIELDHSNTSILNVMAAVATLLEENNDSRLIYIEEMILILLTVAFTMLAIRKITVLKFSIMRRQNNIDEFLLFLAYFFSTSYLISGIFVVLNNAEAQKDRKDWATEMHCLVSLVELMETTLQVYFIQDAFHRCSDKEELKLAMPGQQIVTCLMGMNFSLWVIKSFQLPFRDLFESKDMTHKMSRIPIIIGHPLTLLFRFHCVVCLSLCRHQLYEDEASRLEEIWRHEKVPFSEMLESEFTAHDGTRRRALPMTASMRRNPLLHMIESYSGKSQADTTQHTVFESAGPMRSGYNRNMPISKRRLTLKRLHEAHSKVASYNTALDNIQQSANDADRATPKTLFPWSRNASNSKPTLLAAVDNVATMTMTPVTNKNQPLTPLLEASSPSAQSKTVEEDEENPPVNDPIAIPSPSLPDDATPKAVKIVTPKRDEI